MIEAGVLTENDRVELLEGHLVSKMPHNPRHDSAITKGTRIFLKILPEDWVVRVQCAITTRDSEPEPDFVLAEGPEEKYDSRHPMPSEIGLVVEVSDSTLEYDRNIKGRLYSRSRVEVYWIINLVDKTVEVYTEPKSGRNAHYDGRVDYHTDEKVPLVLRGTLLQRIPVSSLLPAD
ncbi:MAG: Uma2 family endonuclease [Planctomycetes bacterium]|nr:Uma2 family endonuclease [Planctomycetota bacterium]